jgi:hypothetical protein
MVVDDWTAAHHRRRRRQTEPPDEWVDQLAGLPEQRIVSVIEICDLLGVNGDRDTIRLIGKAMHACGWTSITFGVTGAEPMVGYLRDLPIERARSGDLDDIRRALQRRVQPKAVVRSIARRDRAVASAYDDISELL